MEVLGGRISSCSFAVLEVCELMCELIRSMLLFHSNQRESLDLLVRAVIYLAESLHFLEKHHQYFNNRFTCNQENHKDFSFLMFGFSYGVEPGKTSDFCSFK